MDNVSKQVLSQVRKVNFFSLIIFFRSIP